MASIPTLVMVDEVLLAELLTCIQLFSDAKSDEFTNYVRIDFTDFIDLDYF